jgi:transcriptional regulator with XRE-family HTH domain
MTITHQTAVGVIPEWTTRDRLRKARENAGYTQIEFAEVTGLSRRTISGAESGEREPGRAALNLWQMATGVPREWLETGTTPTSPVGPGRIELPTSTV